MGNSEPVRRRLFPLLALLLPVLALLLLEGALRLGGYGSGTRLFAPQRLSADDPGDQWVRASPQVGRRWFSFQRDLPTPLPEPFRAVKPARGLRIFVLGESAAAGFPHGFNGSFSRVVRDALQDVLPADTIEVVNLGMAAINSFAWVDMTEEVLAQRPDAVFIYGGHNEYYGAFGAASTQGLRGPRAAVRAWLALQRSRTVLLVRNATLGLAARLRSEPDPGLPGADQALMRRMVRQEVVPLDGPTYRQGIDDYRANLTWMIRRFREAGVPVLVASVPSNLREQPPFRSVTAGDQPPAMAVYESAAAAFIAGDTAAAAPLFSRARDLDALRFRAPSELSAVVREVAAAMGARYVPAVEAFDSAGRGGVPGNELFAEHVHPSVAGSLLLGRLFFEAVAAEGFLGRTPDLSRLAPWESYGARMELTELDRRLAVHQVRQLKSRWPFTESTDRRAYPWVYQREGVADSLAFDLALGRLSWVDAKVAMAVHARASGDLAGAVAEYAGLVRSDPSHPAPRVARAEVLLAMGDTGTAVGDLEAARALGAVRLAAIPLGRIALAREDYATALARLEEGLPYAADQAALLFELSRVAILARDLPRAVRHADELHARQPGYPGLAEWRQMLAGLRP